MPDAMKTNKPNGPTRYSPSIEQWGGTRAKMVVTLHGEYVLYSDYQAVVSNYEMMRESREKNHALLKETREQLAAAVAERDRLREDLSAVCELVLLGKVD